MTPTRRFDPLPNVPQWRKPRGPKIVVIAILAVVYVAGFFLFSHRPSRPHTASPPTVIDIPVSVVKFRQRIPAPPPLIVHLDAPPAVIIPPPHLHVRDH